MDLKKEREEILSQLSIIHRDCGEIIKAIASANYKDQDELIKLKNELYNHTREMHVRAINFGVILSTEEDLRRG